MPTREEYQMYKRAGICPMCKNRDAEKGRVHCRRCADVALKWQRENPGARRLTQ